MTDVEARDENDDSTSLATEESFSSIDENNQRDWSKTWGASYESISRDVRKYVFSVGRRIFGDKYGLALFCGALAFFMLYWRIGVMINDSYTIANGLVAVSEGHLSVDRAVYGPGLETPGMVEIDGRAYARNYGQIIAALPFLWLIQGVDAVADLRVALAGGWSLLLLSLGMLGGRLVDRNLGEWDSRSVGMYLGSIVAILVFILVLRGSTTIEPKWHHLIALQLQTMVAAGLLGVVIYRLLTRMYDSRVGLAAGGLVVFASPITLWAIFPKRHVLVALAVFVSIYCLYRSREARGDVSTRGYRSVCIDGRTIHVRKTTTWRATMYVPVGFLTWVNPLEGFLLLIALLVVDVLTSGTDISSHLSAGFTCFASLVPFFVTNTLITGNPLESSDTFGRYGSEGVAGQNQGGTTGGGAGGSGSATGSTGGAGEAVSSTPFDSFFGALSVASDFVEMGVSVVTTDFDTLAYLFLHSGYVGGLYNGGDALRLSYLEAMPVAAVFVAIPFLLLRCDIQVCVRDIVESRQLTSVSTVDFFVVIYAGLVTLIFGPQLPMPAEITIRYLLVLFPLTAYGMMRIPTVRRVIRTKGPWYSSAYLAGVLIVGQLLFLYMFVQGVVMEEAFQIHSYVGLSLATLVGTWVLVDAVGWRNDRIGAIVLGMGAAASTVFVLIILLWFSTNGNPIAFPLL